jgi:membrane protein YqaA with SNARE-associated domain
VTPALFFVALSGALVSSLVPLVNAELLLIGLAVATPGAAPLLVLVMAAGQMVGKSVLFLGGGRLTRTALEGRLTRWRLDGRTRRAGAPIVGISAFTGLPPFYLVSVAAPALGVRFPSFLALGLAGRLLRFGVLVALPQIIARSSRVGGL